MPITQTQPQENGFLVLNAIPASGSACREQQVVRFYYSLKFMIINYLFFLVNLYLYFFK